MTRDELLAAHAETVRDLKAATDQGASVQRYSRIIERQREVLGEYEALLPHPVMARCPFTGELFSHSIDDVDLDGLWWNNEAPARPEDRFPATYFALLGAVRLGGAVPDTMFLVKPGPEAPYVIPRMLEHKAVKAVVSSLPVGEHMAYPIVYFAQPIPHELPRANTWGTNEYWFENADGEWRWDSQDEDETEFDYDLRPWIERGKLSWVAPGDADVELQTSVEGCPYLDLPGHRSITRIQFGEAWWPEDVLSS